MASKFGSKKTLQCQTCNAKFYSSFNYNLHRRIHHNDVGEPGHNAGTGYSETLSFALKGHQQATVGSNLNNNNNNTDKAAVSSKDVDQNTASETGGHLIVSNELVVRSSTPLRPGLQIVADKVALAAIERLRRSKSRPVIRRNTPAAKNPIKVPAVDLNRCRFCDMKLRSHNKLLGHVALFHFDNLYAASGWKCAFCEIATGSEKALLRHVVAEHNVLGHTINVAGKRKAKETFVIKRPTKPVPVIDLSQEPLVLEQVPDKDEVTVVEPGAGQAAVLDIPDDEEAFSI